MTFAACILGLSLAAQATSRYEVTMMNFAFGKVDDAIRVALTNAKVRFRLFCSGREGEQDGFLLIEKIC